MERNMEWVVAGMNTDYAEKKKPSPDSGLVELKLLLLCLTTTLTAVFLFFCPNGANSEMETSYRNKQHHSVNQTIHAL